MALISTSWKNITIKSDKLFRTVVLVGQSNTAIAGIYKDLEYKTEEQIDTLFGADSHLAFLIKDSVKMFNGFVKPKLMAVSYQDIVSDVARALELQITGTASEDRLLQIKVNSLNPDRVSTQTASAFASFFTEDATCVDFVKNGKLQRGSIRNIASGYHPMLANVYDNDVIIDVSISSGMTQNQIATAINTAINAKANCLYNSTVATNTLTLTATHKGLISQNFTFEIIKSTIPAGITTSISQTVAGSGIVDISNILNLTDSEGDKLGSLDFDYIVVPYGLSISNLVIDSKAKFDNVLQFNNKALDYHIFQAKAVDLSNDTEINALATANPLSENGLTRSLIVVEKKDNFTNKPIYDYSKKSLIEFKQFIPLEREREGAVFLGNCYSLSNDSVYKDLTKLFSVSAIREVYVEHLIPLYFTGSETYDENGASTEISYNKSDIITIFQQFRDIIDGSNISTVFLNRFSNLIKSNSDARSQYDEILENSINFDSSQTLSVNLFFNLVEAIKNLYITSFNK